MRHQAWLGSAESLTLYAKLEEKWAATGANEMKAFYDEGSKEISSSLGASLIEVRGDKAIINIQGSLVNADAWWHKYAAGEVTSYAAIKGAASQLAGNADIKEVILNVSSGGGSFSGLSSTGKALRTLGKVKKVVGYTEDVSASAGYWLLSSASKVYASETAELGSIGVIAMYQDVSKALQEDGIKFHVVKAGKFKDYGNSFSEFSEEELGYLQSRVDQAYKFFVKHVASARKLSTKSNEHWAEAQMFFAEEAKQVGLIDEVADFSDIITASAPTSSTKKAEYGMHTYEEKLAMIASGASPEEVLSADELNTFNDDNKQAEETTPEVLAEVTEAVVEETEVPASAGNFDMAIKLGRTEARLEDSEAKLALLQEKNELLQAQTSSLLKVAQAAVGNLQVALQKPKEVKGSADEVIMQFDTLKGELATRFPSGRQSSAKENERMDFTAKIPDPYQAY